MSLQVPDSIVGPIPWLENHLPPTCQTLPELLDFQASIHPDAPALVAGTTRLTYREFSDRVGRFAAVLQNLGITAESRVALLGTNTEEWLVAAFASLRLGVSLDTFNTWVLSWDLQQLMEASSTQLLIMVPSVRSTDMLGQLRQLVPEFWDSSPGEVMSAQFPDLTHLIVLGGDFAETPMPAGGQSFDDLITRAEDWPVPPNAAIGTEAALVMYTSGTTQRPKAVPLRHRHLIENGYAIGTRMGLTGEDRVWLSSPLFWSFGGANATMATLTHGACLVLQEHFSADEAATLLADERCTAAYLLPSLSLVLAEEVGERIRAIDSLRTGLVIGRPDEVKRVAVDLGIGEICNVYGSTEVYGNCCVTPHTMSLDERITTQGPPLQGVEVRVVDLQTGEVVPMGDDGELQIRGRVTEGYVDNAEATEAAITADGWYRTGDAGLIRPDGTVQFLSRHTDMIKTSGINVSPAEVEAFIESSPSVDEVAVVGAPHPGRGEVPIAFVVLHSGEKTTAEDIRSFCKGSIAGYKVPWAVKIVSELPHTPTGKMVRKDLIGSATAIVESLLVER
ncbi:long-chain fatty acid--CoA ligase [Cryobacterium sp. TMT1-2-2]|nr:long-chain fatty acid--CoA ligase [Cryobacterium sp. TMT1-66-1]TFD15348.1 long-chain fatty acid--CoA ligase [Cryobacterium sp. TMT1-2-2]